MKKAFSNDKEKMKDFYSLSKKDFLESYSYINEESYDITKRLEEIRTEINKEEVSYGELAELQDLAEYIDDNDVELLELAGVEEKI